MKRVIIFLLMIIVPIPAYSVITSDNLHSQVSMISILNLLSKDTCDSLGNEMLKLTPYSPYGIAHPKNPTYCHDQMYPYPERVEGHMMTYRSGINIYPNIKLIYNGYVLKEGDKVPVGATITAKINIEGSWFRKGGPVDCPEINWVTEEQFNSIIDNTINYHSIRPILLSPQLSELKQPIGIEEKTKANPSIVGDANITLYKVSGIRACTPSINLALVCTVGSETSDDAVIKIEKPGPIKIEKRFRPKCFFYNEKGWVSSPEWHGAKRGLRDHYRILVPENPEWDIFANPASKIKYFDLYGNWSMELPNILSEADGYATVSAEVIAIEDCKNPPEIVATEARLPENPLEGDEVFIRIVLENRGEIDARVNKAIFNLPEYKIIFMPDQIKAGEKSEIMVMANATDITIELTLKYRSTEVGCLNETHFEKTFKLGAMKTEKPEICSTNADCPVGKICCAGLCRELAKGFCDDIDGDGIPDTWIKI